MAVYCWRQKYPSSDKYIAVSSIDTLILKTAIYPSLKTYIDVYSNGGIIQKTTVYQIFKRLMFRVMVV